MDDRRSRLKALLEQLPRADGPKATALLAAEALSLLQRDESPELWGALQGTFAASLANLAGGRFTNETFARVLGAYEAALTVFTPESSPRGWADTQRNIGATHLGAVRSGLGNILSHLDAAIEAYRRALELPFSEHDPSAWALCQQELGDALALSAMYGGPSGFVPSVRAYEAALSIVAKENAPDWWATLQLRRARSLNETGDEQFAEEAIHACELALQVLLADSQPREWAEAHLLLGGLYRTRRGGRRDENLERATESLDNALTVFTREATPREWFQVHYHRGPAYLFRNDGDRAENVERALESLHIAIDATPREHASYAWASLQATVAQAYLARKTGEADANIESALIAFEAARDVLTPEADNPVWVLTNRLLGQTYLARARGDREENTEKAIAALEAAQATRPTADDPSAWCAAQANLGLAYVRRSRGDGPTNLARAIDCLAAAVVSPEAALDPVFWTDLQCTLALTYFKQEGVIGETAPVAEERSVAFEDAPRMRAPAVVEKADPLGMARQSAAQTAAYLDAFRAGDSPLEPDPDYHVPHLLNEEGSLLRHHLEQFLFSRAVSSRGTEERSELEIRRWNLFSLALEHIFEKRHAAERTRALFEEVERGTSGFVLFLRGFAYRAHPYAGVTLVHASGDDLHELIEKETLVKKLTPIPLVWISNPVDSGPLELVSAEADADALGFRVESAASWEADVGALISAASFIVVHNPKSTPGLVAEIALIEELGRRQDTFFYSPEQAAESLGLPKESFNALTDAALAQMREATKGRRLRPGTLPAPTCPWIDGARRARVDAEVRAVARWTANLAGIRTPLSIDLMLDAYAHMLATLVFLEEVDRLRSVLRALSELLLTVGEEHLPEARRLGESYGRVADRLRSAGDQASTENRTGTTAAISRDTSHREISPEAS